MTKKSLALFAISLFAALIVACAPAQPETIIETVVLEGEGGETVVETVVVEAPTEAPQETTMSDVFVTGIFDDIQTTNFWNYLGPGSDVWTGYVLSGQYPTLYTYSNQRFDYIPGLAADLPTARTEEGDFVVSEVTMLEGLTWSDGETVNAEDVVFTFNTIADLNLGGNWGTYNPASLDRVEMVDDLTVRFYFTETPGVAVYEFGTLFAPIMPEHFWGPVVAESEDALAAVGEAPEAPGDDASDDAIAAYEEELASFQEAQAEARNILYQADSADAPVFGPFKWNDYEAGAFASKGAVEGYAFAGLTETQYADGAVVVEQPGGSTFSAYGDESGDVTLELVSGPYLEEVVYSIYNSQDAAFLALQDGEVDYVFSPLGLSQGLLNQVQGAQDLNITQNQQNGFRYLAFNTRKAPMNDLAFRQAVATVVDQPFITDTILGGAAIPAFSVVPPGNEFWYNPDVTRWGFDDEGNSLTRQQRFEDAKQILIDAGYSWDEEPVFDEDSNSILRGTVLINPDGSEMEELEMLAPNSGYDPLRATAAVWVEEFVNDLGIPLRSNLVPFTGVLIPTIYQEGEGALEFDMFIAGWGLSIFPSYLEAFFASYNDSAAGGVNTTGFDNEEFDALIAELNAATSVEEAQGSVYEAQDIIATELPYVVLFTNPIYDVYRTNVNFPYTEILDGIQGANGLTATVQVTE